MKIRSYTSSKYDQSIDEDWTREDIIRNKATGHPYKVIHVYKALATILVDLENKSSLTSTVTLMPSGYSDYAKDRDMSVKKNDWEYNPVYL